MVFSHLVWVKKLWKHNLVGKDTLCEICVSGKHHPKLFYDFLSSGRTSEHHWNWKRTWRLKISHCVTTFSPEISAWTFSHMLRLIFMPEIKMTAVFLWAVSSAKWLFSEMSLFEHRCWQLQRKYCINVIWISCVVNQGPASAWRREKRRRSYWSTLNLVQKQ